MEVTRPTLAPDASPDGQNLLTVPAQINGQEEILPSTFDVISPFTGTAVWKASSATPADGIRAAEAAKAALPGWSATHPKERQRIILKAADILFERREEISAIWRTETGANQAMTSGFITPTTCDFIRAYACKATAIQGSVPCVDTPGESAMVWKVPVGVVLSVLPWNVPPVFAPRAIAAPLIAGCTAVVKASDLSPRTYHALAKCYIDAGAPPGTVNVLTCDPSSAEQLVTTLIEHPAIRKISFTGSTTVGRKIAATAGANLKPVVMELGGKNSAIVLDDANLETAAVQVILGAFLNTGQACMATDRILVHEKIAPQFEAVFTAVLGKMFNASNAPDALISPAARDRVEALVAEATAAGASILNGAWQSPSTPTPSSSAAAEKATPFVRPLILRNTTPSMRIWTHEIFGSVACITPFDTEEQAIALANDSEYGLSHAVFTENLGRGLRVARALESGQVRINAMTVYESPELPFGGVKASGWGRVNAMQGIEEFLVSKAVTWVD